MNDCRVIHAKEAGHEFLLIFADSDRALMARQVRAWGRSEDVPLTRADAHQLCEQIAQGLPTEATRLFPVEDPHRG